MKNRIEFCKNQNIQPRIYVACLAAYNSGYLHGAWIDANQDSDGLYIEVNKMLAKSPVPLAEEFAIHDYEGFGGIYINEYENLESISEMAHFIAEHYELGAAVLEHVGDDIKEAQRLLDECYHGEYESEKDFAASYAADAMVIPVYLQYYIDYEKIAWDLFVSDFFSVSANNRVHVFSNG